MKFKNILVILNPENEKQYALARAVRLVNEQNSDAPVKITTFMTVYDLSYEMSTLLSPEERHLMHQGVITQRQKMIQPYFEKYKSPNIEFNSIVVWSNNEAEAAVSEIAKVNYDIVVKYTQQESISSLIFTPMDWQLLRKCPIPIMLIRDGDWRHQRRILIAVNVADNDDNHILINKKLVSLGLDLADILERGNIHLVTAYPPAPINMAIDLPEFNSTDCSNSIRNQYLLNMKELRQKFGIDEAHTHVKEGFPEDVIPEVAKEIEAEIVVLGTIGRTGLSAALLGNTAEQVINKLNCSLLAIKPNCS
ncbi:universal stress protein UspE [Avibacterium paragallinarum]|uniref:universal stress protein UspE n=1 Tax=Avibacterium paragallinarum TaxID=728 RepID=UPI00398759F2